MSPETIFETARRKRWTGTKALVLQTECPFCGEPYDRSSWVQLPLLRHGGYGEAVKTTMILCRCRMAAIRVEAVSPR